MTRALRTLLLSVTALGALATAAAAAPPVVAPSHGDMTGMHATGAPQMHTGPDGMAGMHAAMMADPAVHESMLDDPVMQAHMAAYGVDIDQMRQWHDTAASVDEMHEALAAQGVDVDAMQADCPMLSGDAMATMHGAGGGHLDHHPAPGR